MEGKKVTGEGQSFEFCGQRWYSQHEYVQQYSCAMVSVIIQAQIVLILKESQEYARPTKCYLLLHSSFIAVVHLFFGRQIVYVTVFNSPASWAAIFRL